MHSYLYLFNVQAYVYGYYSQGYYEFFLGKSGKTQDPNSILGDADMKAAILTIWFDAQVQS